MNGQDQNQTPGTEVEISRRGARIANQGTTPGNGPAAANVGGAQPAGIPKCISASAKAQDKKNNLVSIAEQKHTEEIKRITKAFEEYKLANPPAEYPGFEAYGYASNHTNQFAHETWVADKALQNIKDSPLYLFGDNSDESFLIWRCEKAAEELSKASKELKDKLAKSPQNAEVIKAANDKLDAALAKFSNIGTVNDIGGLSYASEYATYESETRSFLADLGIGLTPYLGSADGGKDVVNNFYQGNYGSAMLGTLTLIPFGKAAKVLGKGAFKLFSKVAPKTAQKAAQEAAEAKKLFQEYKKSRAVHGADEALPGVACRICKTKAGG